MCVGNGRIFVSLVLVLTVFAVTPMASFAGGLVISGDNVGIGTNTPFYPLDVQSDTRNAISGYSSAGAGINGSSDTSVVVAGYSTSGYAGYFDGSVRAAGQYLSG